MSIRDPEEVRAAAMGLPADERERLAHDLLDSLDDEEHLSPEAWQSAWDEEIERRVREIRDGKAHLIDAEEVFRRARQRLADQRK